MAVSTRLALTEATVENGCLHIAPGTHGLGDRADEVEAEDGERRSTPATWRASV
ncbi:phytanoyl-CoA dioxygenase family protein [Streptomyces sp. NPDC048338]|uniref:phytanoyl-CoA dioxygenase family protein n=1 Tax=Streptomyces sp. NPDC048338 TaxID=3365536 RepID=UPI003716FF2F